MGTEDLDAIKSDPGVIRVYSQYVKGLKKTGDKWVGLCPLHGEKSPSFTVFKDMRSSCFGCGENLNIFQLVQKMDNCDFKTALEKVKAEVGTWSETKDKVESTFKSVAEPKVYKTLPLEQWQKVEDALTNSREALDWLNRERGIGPGTAQRMHVGFVQNIGNLAGEAGSDIANKGWIAFPCVEGEKIISVKYRSLQRKKPGGFARQPGMATAMFGMEEIDPFEPVYVVEGEFDQLCMTQAGFRCVSVPSAGVKLTPEMKDKLMQANQVILAGDTDSAGTSAFQKLWAELGERTYLLTWEDGAKDANEFFLKACNRDQSIFRTRVEELTSKAKSQPMPSVYSLQETLLNGDSLVLADHPDRMRFPWSQVDSMVNIMPGDVIGVNATNSGMGKSTWVTQWTLFNAMKYGRTILNYQTEMRPSEIATMVAANILRKDRNFLTGDDKKEAANRLGDIQYYVGSDPTLSDINQVLDLLEAAIKRLSPYAVVLDHFHHLVTGMHNEAQVQSAAMTRIKSIAEIYKVVFINVGQPRKATQQTKGKQIHLSDAKGSGAWGDAANAVICIHRDLNKSEDPTMSKGVYEDKTLVKLLKGRSMGTGASAAYLTSFGEFASFEQLDTTHSELDEL
jgi:hypothetical protein